MVCVVWARLMRNVCISCSINEVIFNTIPDINTHHSIIGPRTQHINFRCSSTQQLKYLDKCNRIWIQWETRTIRIDLPNFFDLPFEKRNKRNGLYDFVAFKTLNNTEPLCFHTKRSNFVYQNNFEAHTQTVHVDCLGTYPKWLSEGWKERTYMYIRIFSKTKSLLSIGVLRVRGKIRLHKNHTSFNTGTD